MKKQKGEAVLLALVVSAIISWMFVEIHEHKFHSQDEVCIKHDSTMTCRKVGQ